MTVHNLIRFPTERTRPALTMCELRLRRALSATACDLDTPLNARIRATERLLDRPNMRDTERDLWRDLLDQLKTRARRNARAMVDAGHEQGSAPDGEA